MKRRICLAGVGVALAGCLRGPSVSDEEAIDRALAAERAHVGARLEDVDCVTEWTTDEDELTVPQQGRVDGREGDTSVVTVIQPYGYTTEDGHEEETGSEAVYAVDPERDRRIEGDEINPCE